MPNKLLTSLGAACLLAAAAPAWTAETPTNVGAAACASCHAEIADGFAKTHHGRKAKSTKTLAEGCESCHGPGSLHAAAAGDKNNPGWASIKMPKLMTASEQNEFCLTCHKDFKQVMLWKTSAHAANGVSCLKCHSVHEGEGRQSMAKGESETCLQCHLKQKADMRLASHHPIPEGKMSCTGCHNPHGGPKGNLVAEEVNETCAKCHSEKVGPFADSHPPVEDDCLNCHQPHGSQNDRLLKQPQPFLCMACHKWPHQIRPGAASGNTPVINGNFPALSQAHVEQRARCTDCHREIHGSDFRADFKSP